jgi:hypothetical protein
MADEPSENKEESEAEVAARRFRSDWFGRALGDEWMEVEPGIYRHVTERAQIPPAKPRGQEEQSQAVDQTLLQALSFDQSDLLPAAPVESKRRPAAPSAPSAEVGDRPGRWR